MKNKFSFLTALWWILLLAVLGFFLLAATDKHSRESEDENRMLAAFPTLNGKSLADASFMNGFEDFLSDAFFGRESVTKFTDRVMDKFSVLTAEEEAVQKAEEMDRRLQAEGAADGENPAEKPAADAPRRTRRRSRFTRMSRRLRTRWTIRTKTWKKSRCSAATRSSAGTRAICG